MYRHGPPSPPNPGWREGVSGRPSQPRSAAEGGRVVAVDEVLQLLEVMDPALPEVGPQRQPQRCLHGGLLLQQHRGHHCDGQAELLVRLQASGTGSPWGTPKPPHRRVQPSSDISTTPLCRSTNPPNSISAPAEPFLPRITFQHQHQEGLLPSDPKNAKFTSPTTWHLSSPTV